MSDGPTEYPTEDELPDDPPDPEEIDPWETNPDEFDDFNEWLVAEHEATQDAPSNE